MKKLILSVCLMGITFFCGYSQMYLTLSDSLGALPNNSSFNRQGLPSAGEIISYIFVKNNSASTMHVKVKKVEISLIDSSLNYFCWGLCYANTIYVSPYPVDIPAGATDTTSFSGHYSPHGTVGASIIRYVFFDQDNPSDTVCTNVHYDTYPLGIDNTSPKNNTAISAYPNPSDNFTNFTYQALKDIPASLVIRNILGTVVKEINLTNAEARIGFNTSDLGDGIYFYTLVENGLSVSTQKLIVKH